MLPGTRKIMQALRERARTIRPNNARVDEWCDAYVEQCALVGQRVKLLSQCCLSKDLEVRYREPGEGFKPTPAEDKLFSKELPWLFSLFSDEGVGLDYCFTFNRTFLPSGKVDSQIELAYVAMVSGLVNDLTNIAVLDWEWDVLGRPFLPQGEYKAIASRVPVSAFSYELERHSTWSREDAHLQRTDAELKQEVELKILGDVEEAQLLVSPDGLFGEQFMLLPLEAPERYALYNIGVPEFTKRVVPVLSTYPWRLSA